MLNVRYLHYFCTLAEIQHVTKAAQVLHIAQPALSVAIKHLETHFQLSLFHRQGRKITLTPEGEALLPHARSVLQQLDSTERAMADLRGVAAGEVKLGITGMLGTYYFPPLLMAFQRQYPQLKITLVEAGGSSLKAMLLAGDIDIAVVVDQDIPDELTTQRILRSQMVAVTSDHHPLATLPSISFARFLSEPLILCKQGYFHRDYIDRAIAASNAKPNIAFETNLLAMILQAVRHQHAITALFEIVTDNEPGLTPIPFDEPIVLDIALAWRSNGYLSVAHKTFIEFLQNNKHATPNE